MSMVEAAHEQLLRRAYDAFNARDLDAALATMHPDVDWPNAFEGGRVQGRDAVRAYWTRQFGQIDSRVEPTRVRAIAAGDTAGRDGTSDGATRIAVDIRQVVHDTAGTLLSDRHVIHEYVVRDGLVARMDVVEPPTHRYAGRVAWSGSTAVGYDSYPRAHEASASPAQRPLKLSSDPAFGGDPAQLNPEQLLVLAASSCQMLSFLAVAARARIDVTNYEDDAEGVMPEADRPMRITRIVLRPVVTIRGDRPDEGRLRQLIETAHRHCFIANSLTTEIALEPTFRRAE
ncbi:MAG TPA: OsmC family protein [Conexibacter sp.]|jgi:organic hydroperoxide reductase OsmC/OhrA|nr:OsmC family protein [Conexibacter sp.]